MKTSNLGLALIFSAILIPSCVNHDLGDASLEPTTDASLFAEATSSGFTYYQNGAILAPVSPSPHGPFKLRFNSVASTVLDNTGELPEDGRFPDGSVIVKEGYQNNTLSLVIAIRKAPADDNASSGWVWGAYLLDGTPTISIEDNGSQCVDCHSNTPNRDLIRTFDLH
jgi:hypothetical protein